MQKKDIYMLAGLKVSSLYVNVYFTDQSIMENNRNSQEL